MSTKHVFLATVLGLLGVSPLVWGSTVRQLEAGKIVLKEIAEPASPSSGHQMLYIDSADNKPKRKKSDGSVVELGAGGGGSAGYNMISTSGNADFDANTSDWTASGGTFSRVTSGANLLIGDGSASWDASASSQTLSSTAIAIPAGLYGRNCLAKILYKGGDSNLTLKVSDGTNTLGSQALSAATNPREESVSFICPSSGNLQVVLESSADAAIVYLDQVHLGENYKLGTVAQATLHGRAIWTASANCNWSTTSTSYGDFAADADCTLPSGSNLVGSASAPDTKIPAIKFSSLPPGRYVVRAVGMFRVSGNSSGYDNRGRYRIYDGSTAVAEEFDIKHGDNASGSAVINTTDSVFISEHVYTTAQSNVTFRIQGKVISGSTTTFIDTNEVPLVITVYKYPLESETVYRAEVAQAHWSGYHGNDCTWSTTSTSYVEPTADATCTLTERKNRNFGSVSAYASGKPGIVFTPKRATTYWVCAIPKFNADTSGDWASVELSDSSGTVIGENQNRATSANGQPIGLSICGMYSASSTSPVSLRLRLKTSANTSAIQATTSASASTIEWSIVDLLSLQMPQFVGSVGTSSAGQERIERVSFGGASEPSVCSASPCTLYRSTPGISSITRSAAGTYSVNFAAGTFSAAPTCTYTSYNDNSYARSQVGVAVTSSAWAILTRDTNTQANTDSGGHIICMGPK